MTSKKPKTKIQTLKPRIPDAPQRIQPLTSWRAEKKSSTARGYGYRWQKAREAFLAVASYLCVTCKAEGRIAAATVVDHKTPHRGDQALFWNRANWQALCKTCHDRKTASEEGHGFGYR